MARRTALTALLAFCITGCASTQKSLSGHMAPESAAEYAAMAPEEFVKTRFYTEDLGFLGRLSEKLGPDNRPPGRRPTKPTLSADGRMVVSVAHYTDINYHQLTRPRQNLQLYCESARRGQWQQVQGFEDPIAAAQLDLATVYSEAEFHTLERLRQQNGDSGYAPAEEALARTTAALTTERAAEQNAQLESDYAGAGFRKALYEGAFGVFQCDESTGSWSVSVLPKHFYPGDRSNLLVPPTALIAIRLLASR
jgi:hypothetical protein